MTAAPQGRRAMTGSLSLRGVPILSLRGRSPKQSHAIVITLPNAAGLLRRLCHCEARLRRGNLTTIAHSVAMATGLPRRPRYASQ